jgi:hypothetical protein
MNSQFKGYVFGESGNTPYPGTIVPNPLEKNLGTLNCIQVC